MIRSFKCKETERLFNGRFSKKLPQDIQRLAARKLTIIHAAGALNDLRTPPANRLEALSADRGGTYSIRVNKQWRICFEWHQDGAYAVEITDYH